MRTDWKIGRIRSAYFILQARANPIIEPNGKKANAMASFEETKHCYSRAYSMAMT